jgi:hypothetical protein
MNQAPERPDDEPDNDQGDDLANSRSGGQEHAFASPIGSARKHCARSIVPV